MSSIIVLGQIHSFLQKITLPGDNARPSSWSNCPISSQKWDRHCRHWFGTFLFLTFCCRPTCLLISIFFLSQDSQPIGLECGPSGWDPLSFWVSVCLDPMLIAQFTSTGWSYSSCPNALEGEAGGNEAEWVECDDSRRSVRLEARSPPGDTGHRLSP